MSTGISTLLSYSIQTLEDAKLHFFGREGYEKIRQRQWTWADLFWPFLAVVADMSSTLGPVASGGLIASVTALILFASLIFVRSRYCQLCAIPCAISFVLTLSFGIVLGLQTLTASDDLGVIRSSLERMEASLKRTEKNTDTLLEGQKKAEAEEQQRKLREAEAKAEADRKHQEQLAGQNKILEGQEKLRLEIAREKGIEPKFLTPLFEAAGQDANIKPDQFETAVRAAVEALIARSKNPVQPSNDGADIDAAIRAARQKLAQLDTEGALAILRKQEAEEAALVQSRNRGRASLKKEEAAIYKSAFRYTEAITALNEAIIIDPDSIEAWFELGDVHWMVLRAREPALAAYIKAEALAKRLSLKREESAALDGKGNVLVVFDPESALKAYQESLKIRKALAEGDNLNKIYWQDLSVSYIKIGDMLRGTDSEAALNSYQNAFVIAKDLAEEDKLNWQYQQNLAATYSRAGDMLVRSDPKEALKYYNHSYEITKNLYQFNKGNRQHQDNLSSLSMSIGNVLVESDPIAALKVYEEGLAIIKKLTEEDKANKHYQRGLFAFYMNIGDALHKNNPAVARKMYQDGFVIIKTLAEEDRLNRQYQQDLISAYFKISLLAE